MVLKRGRRFSAGRLHPAQPLQVGKINNEGMKAGASRGAKIILWPEMASVGTAVEVEAVLTRAHEVARQERVYLVTGIQINFSNEERPVDNRIIMITTSGDIAVNQLSMDSRCCPAIHKVMVFCIPSTPLRDSGGMRMLGRRLSDGFEVNRAKGCGHFVRPQWR